MTRYEDMNATELAEADAKAREALAEAFAARTAIVRERERRSQQVAVVGSAEIAAEPGAPLTASHWLEKRRKADVVQVPIYAKSIDVDEHRQLRAAIDKAALDDKITWVADGAGKRLAAIVPIEVAETGETFERYKD